ARRPGGLYRPRPGGPGLRRRHRRPAGVAAAAPAHLLLPAVLRPVPARPAPDGAVREAGLRSAAGVECRPGRTRGDRRPGGTAEPEAQEPLLDRGDSRSRFHFRRLFTAEFSAVRLVLRGCGAEAAGAAAPRPSTGSRHAGGATLTTIHGDKGIQR